MPVAKNEFNTQSPLLNAFKIVSDASKTYDGASKMFGSGDSAKPQAAGTQAGGDDNSALGRKIAEGNPQDHIQNGHNILNDPNTNLAYEDRESFFKSIAMAMHGINSDPQMVNQGGVEKQGSLGSGMDNLKSLVGIAAMLA